MAAKEGSYHHGDLRSALVDAAIGVIAERGVRGFSLAEASRRLGVTTAAPYRHFADRDDLLAAVAARALSVFAAMLAGAADTADTPAQRLAAMAGAYVRFAAQQRPLFDTIYNSGLDKSRYPELQRAWEPVDALLTVVLEVCDGDAATAGALNINRSKVTAGQLVPGAVRLPSAVRPLFVVMAVSSTAMTRKDGWALFQSLWCLTRG